MTGSDLSGQRILVIEDDFYLAFDAARALEGAGAEVLGPCRNEHRALAELKTRRPDAALVDINLGSGPSFRLAGALAEVGVPFVFTTGYDQATIPSEFAGVARLEKPFEVQRLLGAIAKVLQD